MEKRNWRILYQNYNGMEQKAVELVSRELGERILRDLGVYTFHVLPCVPAEALPTDENAVLIGIYSECALIRECLGAREIPEEGYLVSVMAHPDNPDCKLAVITAQEPAGLFYGAVDFVDDYFAFATPSNGALSLPHQLFLKDLPDYEHISAPQVKTRTVFTWGHPINDYRDYIENMARLKLNQLIIWNDFLPANAKDVVDYAHEYGIRVIWGYAWGWSTKCDEIDLEQLEALSDEIVAQYEREYRDAPGDGIYFQSFTELHQDYIGDKLIAGAVTDFVNQTAEKLFAKYPDLFIQFGLHAWSVQNHLEQIARVDPRIEIVWEDCGAFPYDYEPVIRDEKAFEETKDFTNRILSLRKNGACGMLYKGQTIMNWSEFVHQKGPYVMGMASEKIKAHDIALLEPIWRNYQTQWNRFGRYAYEMTKEIIASQKPDITLGMAGMFAGGIWLPEALCAEMLWNCEQSYEELAERVARRACIHRV